MTFLWWALTVLSTAGIITRVVWILRARREAAQLCSPILYGIPLPAVDDPRWHGWHGDLVIFGKINSRCEWPFVVDKERGTIKFEGETIGYWLEYARAVAAPIQARFDQERIDRALKALEEA